MSMHEMKSKIDACSEEHGQEEHGSEEHEPEEHRPKEDEHQESVGGHGQHHGGERQ